MSAPRVMFVNHTSKIAGAELVLIDVVRPWRGATAFLFENGPLNLAMAQQGLTVITSRHGEGLSQVRRDSALWMAAPLAARLCALTLDIARAARRHDVIYANSQKAFVLSAIAMAVVRKPLVWHLHDIIDDAHFGVAQRRLQVALANRIATRVVVPSQAAATAFVSAGGRQDLVDVVPNGIDATTEKTPRAELRRALDLPEGPLAGVFSRLAPWKGQHVVLHALARTPGVGCIIAGDALFGEQAYAAQLKEMVAELGLGDRVRFLGHRNDIARLMRAVDVMIHPSVDPEPFGRTLVEAMLAEVPVIATNAGAASDILDAGMAGTLIAPNDADALAQAMQRVLANPSDLAPQIQYAATRARTRYSVGQMLQSICDLIDRSIAGARA